jgi:DNA-binding CsgD family transcriptional regulator
MAALDQLLSTIKSVHSAAIGDTPWQQALAAVANVADGNAASIAVCDQQSLQHLEMYSHGLPGGDEIVFREDFAELNIRLPFIAQQKLNELSWDHMILDEAAMGHTPFYTEFLPRFDIRYFVAGVMLKNATEFAFVCVHRSPRMGHVQKQGIALMRTLLPHMRQAFDVTRRLRDAVPTSHDIECALDTLHDGAALVKADGTIAFANAAFAAIARRNDGIAVRKDTPVFADPESHAHYGLALAAVLRLRDGDPAPSSASDIVVPRPQGVPPYLVSVRPLLDKERAAASEGVAIVFVRDPLQSRAATAAMLCERFDLTAAEAALARALQSGMTPPGYAHSRGLSLNTIYTHLRRLREKTGCNRLPELIHKLNELHSPLRSG